MLDYRVWDAVRDMGRAAHLRRCTRPSCLTRRLRVEQWAGVPPVRSLVALVLSPRRPAAGGPLDSPLAPARAGARACRTSAPARVGRGRGRPRDRRDRLLRSNADAAARAGVEREARRHVRGADRARARVPDRDRRARRGPAGRRDAGTGDLVLKGYGDPTLSSRRPRVLARQVRAAGIRARHRRACVGDESWFDARRTAPGGRRRSTSTSRRRSRRSSSTARASAARHVARPALAAATAFRDALARGRRRASRRRPCRRAADDGRCRSRSVDSPTLARDRPLHGPRERQLHRGDAAEGARR